MVLAATVFPQIAAADTAPLITLQPINAIASTGATVRFTAEVAGTPTSTVKWRQVTCTLFCGTPSDISGATSPSLSVTASASSPTIRYFAVFANAAGTATTNWVGITLRSAPVVSTTSSTMDYGVGDTKLLSATVTSGSPAPTVQWQQSTDAGATWTNVIGAETTGYSIGPLGEESNGRRYRMVATNAIGSATSGVTTLARATPPAISAQPQNRAVLANTSAAFTVNATGTPTPSVEWQRSSDDGVTWTTQTTSMAMPNTYTTQGLQGLDGWKYRAVLTNAAATVTTDVATLTVGTVPTVANLSGTPGFNVAVGTNLLLTAGLIEGVPTPNLQWSRKGVGESTFSDISNATSASVSIAVVAADIGASYRLVASNVWGSGNGTVIPSVVSLPTISVHPVDRSTAVGSSTSFSSTGTGSPQWQVSADNGASWTNSSGGTFSTLSVFPSSVAQDGSLYRVLYSTLSGSITSSTARLTVTAGPSVVAEPVDQTVAIGQTATFSAQAIAPIASATWQRSTDGGTSWSTASGGTLTTNVGVSTATLAVTGAVNSANGYRYRVVFSRSPGTVTSQSASLTVTGLPTLVSSPTSRSVAAGAATSFFASVTSSGVPTVAWERSDDAGSTWTPLAGGATSRTMATTNASFALPMTTALDDGARFRATFTNDSGSITTAVGTLTVVAVTGEPVDTTVAPDAVASFTASSNQAAATVRWEVMTPAASSYSTVAGATSPTFNVTAAVATNGNLYRAVFTVGSASVVTAAARLHVSATPPAITVKPVGGVAVAGTVLNLTSTSVGIPAPTASWEVSTDAGTTWTAVTAGATSSSTATTTSASLAFPVAPVASTLIRSVFANVGGTTKSATTTVSAVYVVTPPTNAAGQPGVATTFTAAGAGSGYATWEVSTDGGATFSTNANGSSSASTLTLIPTAAMNGNQYRAKFRASNFPNPEYYSTSATLSVNTGGAPTIVSFSNDQLNNRTFTVVAGSSTEPSVAWEYSANGGTTWATIPATTVAWAEPRVTTTLNVQVSLATSGSYRAVVTNAGGETRSTTASYQVEYAPIITSHLQDVTLPTGGVAAYSIGISAVPLPHSYYWEISSNGGATWVDLQSPVPSPLLGSGCGSGNVCLKATQSSPHLLVRVRAVSLKGTVTSMARLDVTGPPVSSIGALSWPVASGSPVKLIRQAYSGAPITSVSWERSDDRGASWAPISGSSLQQMQTPSEFRSELTITPTTADNDARFRAVFTNSYGSVTTEALTLDTNAPVISKQPTSVTLSAPGTAAFSLAGYFYTSVSWQRSNDGGTTWATISGAVSANYSLSATTADSGAKFRARLTSATGTTTSSAASLLVQAAPVVQTHPGDANVAAGAPILLQAGATGLPAPTIQWQRSDYDGASWQSVAGATTPTLSLTASVNLDGVRFRAVFTNVAGTATSDAAVLNVSAVAQMLQFDPAPPTTAGVGSTFPIGATASSGLLPSISVGGPCTLAAGVVTTTGSGVCVVSVTQAGDATYSAAPPLSTTVSIARQAQSITVGPLPTAPVVGSTAPVVASSTSGLPVSLAAIGGCTIAGTTALFSAGGVPCTITASQPGNDAFDSAADVAVTTTAKSVQQITGYVSLPKSPAVGATFDVSAKASSTLPVTFAAAGACTISGRTVTLTSVGTCSVTASQTGNAAWFPSIDIVKTTVVPEGQTIAFAPLPVAPPTGTSLSIRTLASASSGLGITVAANGGGCTASGTTVKFTTAGVPCTVTVSQVGGAYYRAATPVSQTTTPVGGPQSISGFANLPSGLAPGGTFSVAAAASSGLGVTFAASGACTIDARLVAITAAGTCSVRASQAGNASFLPAVDVVRTTVVKADQTIAVLPLPIAPPAGSTASMLSLASASSGLSITVAAAGGCTSSGTTVSFTTAGVLCTVTVSQNGGTYYWPATPVVRETTTMVGTQQITGFVTLPKSLVVGSTFSVAATATSKLPVGFVASGPCTVAVRTVTITGSGICTVTASQAGNASFLPALDVVRTTVVKSAQAITFAPLPAGPAAASSTTVASSSSSGLLVKLVATGGCTVSGFKITFTVAGVTCTVMASQAGSTYVNAAPVVIRTTTPI